MNVVKVIKGPICADGLIFWKLENDSIPSGVGWTAEGDGQEYWLEPYTPQFQQPKVNVGILELNKCRQNTCDFTKSVTYLLA
jgi:hypothetical protein